ncbi:hypothetical protein ACFO3O_13400 [Dokdonia ponticola]|uniref:TIGR04086 family membrane protein n=1 Tax=Dokdonia ponticola TaxID=2041041 RepID=A0ABV9I0W4_9FLAO
MNKKTHYIFVILEVLSGFSLGLFGLLMLADKLLKFDMNLSFILGYLSIFFFALIGIVIPGFFHSRRVNKNKRFLIGIAKATIGMVIGTLFTAFLPTLIYEVDLLRYIVILIPIICSVVGFNMGIRGL